MAPKQRKGRLEFVPLTPERWPAFEELFGPRGACGGCWCMTPRLTRGEYERNKGAGNKRLMRKLVRQGRVPGILALHDGRPAGWCSLEPRERIPSLGRSRILKPVDEQEVWSIVCLFIDREYRRQGLSVRLIREAVQHARNLGARIVEAYPVEPKTDPMPDVFAYTGIASAYLQAGFREVARRSPTRPILRKNVQPTRGARS